VSDSNKTTFQRVEETLESGELEASNVLVAAVNGELVEKDRRIAATELLKMRGHGPKVEGNKTINFNLSTSVITGALSTLKELFNEQSGEKVSSGESGDIRQIEDNGV
jgi:queuine/archaeosine tRNA-ribosyltransferase